MVSHVFIRRRPAGIRLVAAPIASAAQIIRAVLLGLMLAFLFVWALPHGRFPQMSQRAEAGIHSQV
jgi:hypothetical protein